MQAQRTEWLFCSWKRRHSAEGCPPSRGFYGLVEERGSSLIELALLGPLLLLLLTGTVDMGRAFFAAIEVQSAASAGALYGTQNPTDVTGMQKAAVLDGANLANLSATASYGCECSDGSQATASCGTTPSCGTNVVNYVVVTTSLTYTPLFVYPQVPSSLALTGSARMRAAF